MGDSREPRGRYRARLLTVAISVSALVATIGGGPAHATPTTVVVPNANAATEGNGENGWPFNCGGLGLSSQRYQQVYLGSEVTSGVISRLAFRPDGTVGAAFGPTTLSNVTITLSTTSASPGGLSTTFANNVGSDVTTVFSGNLVLSSANTGGPPRSFDIAIPLQNFFSFNATSGNLLLDVTVPTCVTTTQFDAVRSPSSSVDRAYTFSSPSTSPTADFTDNEFAGLVTQFTIDPAQQVVTCQANQTCATPPASNNTNTLTASVSATNTSGQPQTLSVSVGGALLKDCPPDKFRHLPDVVTVDSSGGFSTKQVTFTVMVSKPTAANNFRLCYNSPNPFIAQGGKPAPLDPATNVYFGLLPDCTSSSGPPPCQLSKVKTTTTTAQLVALVPGSDPKLH
jgi:hypothetical protein